MPANLEASTLKRSLGLRPALRTQPALQVKLVPVFSISDMAIAWETM